MIDFILNNELMINFIFSISIIVNFTIFDFLEGKSEHIRLQNFFGYMFAISFSIVFISCIVNGIFKGF